MSEMQQQLSLWLRGGRDPSLGRFPKPPAGPELRGLLLLPVPVPAPVGAALKPPIDFPNPWGTRCLRVPCSTGTLCADVAARGVCGMPGGSCNLFLLNFALLQSWWDETWWACSLVRAVGCAGGVCLPRSLAGSERLLGWQGTARDSDYL